MGIYHQHSVYKLIKPKFFKTEEELKEWLRCLAEDVLGMNICIPPSTVLVSDGTNSGLTGVVGLTTSHCSYHAWDELEYICLDIYSCKPYDVEKVIKFLKHSKSPSEVWYSCFDRDNEDDYENIVRF